MPKLRRKGSNMIQRVKNLSIGDIVIHDGKKCKITGFATRYSVLIKNIEYGPGDFNIAKVSVRDIKGVMK